MPITAASQVPDGNLVEYGIVPAADAQTLVPQPPRMKIFRDGRMVIFDEKGAWQARIDADRIENLERDLLRHPLLQSSRYVEFSQRKPLPNPGGLSYIRFRDGAGEVLVATPGIPLDAEWNAIVDRVNSERPATLLSFRPHELRFYVFSWPDFAGPKLAWPFTATFPLAARDDPFHSDDPAIVAFVLDAIYGMKSPRPPVQADGQLYQFSVESAPGWIDPPALESRITALWNAAGKHGTGTGSQDANLIEYGMGGFADGGHGLMLYPPEVKIYDDGRIVFGHKEGIWIGTIEPRRLERLKKELAANPLLSKTQILPVRNGGLISMHGGMAYIRYRDGDDERIVAVLSHPRRGPYAKMLNRIRGEIPSTYSRFRPKEISFTLYPAGAWVQPVPWPFSATIPLHNTKGSIHVTDPAAIAFVIDHSFGGFSWLQTNVIDQGVNYEIILESAPGWYDPQVLAPTLEMLRLTSQ